MHRGVSSANYRAYAEDGIMGDAGCSCVRGDGRGRSYVCGGGFGRAFDLGCGHCPRFGCGRGCGCGRNPTFGCSRVHGRNYGTRLKG